MKPIGEPKRQASAAAVRERNARRAIVWMLRETGMSWRKIGAALGVTATTAEYTRDRRATARENGFCGICVTRRAKRGRKTCKACLAKHANRKAALRDAAKCECGRVPEIGMKRCLKCRKYNRERAKARRKRCRRLRLCPQCGKRAAPGRALCPRHLKRAVAAQLRKNARRKKGGLCISCRMPNAKGYVHCYRHLALMRNRRKMRSA